MGGVRLNYFRDTVTSSAEEYLEVLVCCISEIIMILMK